MTTPDITAPSRQPVLEQVKAGRSGWALAAAGSLMGMLALQACAPHQPPSAGHAGLPVYAIDQAGAARSCTVSPLTPTAGKESATTMTMANDGGWCAISVHQDGPAPYGAGLLITRPEHGKVFIHSVGDETRIDYTPEQRFGGNDSFAVQLLPGDAVIRVAVTVSSNATPVAAVAPVTAPVVTKKPIVKK